ncbi:MAG: hypothetical protein DRO94_02105 [Candidatus Altiarchaeales archaeon]|nr:MAG: hypothetical protein DRO95_00005 [Candidatus Altiarchaeales archaeon]RLI94748.1 MAG: hypothetical protein DRO94_02105 [Candidatus Altiarchaeales archaeon]HDO82815.1 hypothetical protein [Candidatus Altiarchaeales archaeon]HEX55464.1 hypothetical protein [Candidatus Altiarchaeales archaeon]
MEIKNYLRPVESENSFKLKRDHDVVIAEIHDIEGLRNAIEIVPGDVIAFHMDNRNDFAAWIESIVGCNTLGKALQEIQLNSEDIESTRRKLVEVLDLSISLMKEVLGETKD